MDSFHLTARLRGRVLQRFFAAVGFYFFNFLRGLPKKQVWPDRSAEYGDERHQKFFLKCHFWDQGRAEHRRPWNMHKENYPDIRKERERKPLQVFGVSRIRDEQNSHK